MTSFLSSAFGNGCVLNLNIIVDSQDEVPRAGGRLHGKVIIQVEKGNTGGEVELTLRGKEKSIRKKGPVDVSHHHEFFSQEVKLRSSRKVLFGPTESTVLFALDLPGCLPSSSMHRIGLNDVGFNIQYKLTAKLGSCSKSVPIGIAAAALKCGNSSFLVHPTAQTIFSGKGTNQGSVTVAVSIQNTNIRKGEKVRVAVACRNDSLIKIQRVEAKVVELLNWGSKEGYSKTRANKETLIKLEDIDLPGVQRENENINSIVDSNYRTMEELETLHTAIQNDLVSGLNEIEMVCPLRSRDSYTGVLVDIRHYLKISFITRNAFFGAQPSIKIPLKIGLPEEIPRVFAVNDTVKVEKVAMTNELRTNQLDLPAAFAVPIVATAGNYDPGAKNVSKDSCGQLSRDYDQIKRQVEPMPMPSPKAHFPSAIVERGGKLSSEIELSLHDLVPMVPSMRGCAG